MKKQEISGRNVEVFERHRLTCTTDGHNKFWVGVLGRDLSTPIIEGSKPWVVSLTWGRIGTEGQTPEFKRFTTLSTATTYLRARVKDKLQKGYVVDNTKPVQEPKAPPASYVENTYEWDIL